MNQDENHEAFKFLHGASVPSDEQIDAMSDAELDESLTDLGVDIGKLKNTIAQRKIEFAGRFALKAARKRRLARPAHVEPDLPIPSTKEKIIEALQSRHGEDLPLAARNCSGMEYDELCHLFRDLMSEDEDASNADQ